MKHLVCTLGLVCLLGASALAQSGRTTGAVTVNEDQTVTFRLSAPKAESVTVSGDFGRGTLTKNDNGEWSTTVGPLKPDFYVYALSVDGVRMADPRNPLFKPGNAGIDSMFFVPGPDAEFEATKAVPHGDVRQVWFPAPALGTDRRMHIYTPPGYEGGTESYPVLYLLHGSGDDDTGWSSIGRTGFILDNLIAAGQAKPMIVVMPNGTLSVPEGVKRTGADGKITAEWRAAYENNQALFSKHLVEDVVSYVEKTYRTKQGVENRALAGLSMGGSQTLRVLTTTPEAFSVFGIWSTGISKDSSAAWEKKNDDILKKVVELKPSLKLIEVVVGDADSGAFEGSKVISEVFTRRGIEHQLTITDGGHTWINWRKYLHSLFPRLFQ